MAGSCARSTLDDTRRLVVGDQVVSPVGLQVRAVLASHGDVLFTASTEPTEQHLWGYFADGECVALTTEPGVHAGTGASDVLVVNSASLSHDGVQTVVRKNGVEVGRIASFAEPAPFSPRVSISKQGRRELRTALVLPRDHVEGSGQLPVLMDPYGGPHAQRVIASRGAYLNSQWLADQGFAVVIVDGRGTPGSRAGVGARSRRRSRDGRARGSGRGPAVAGGNASRLGSVEGRDPRLVVRRLPRGAGRATASRRLSCRRRRCARASTGACTTRTTPSDTSA